MITHEFSCSKREFNLILLSNYDLIMPSITLSTNNIKHSHIGRFIKSNNMCTCVISAIVTDVIVHLSNRSYIIFIRRWIVTFSMHFERSYAPQYFWTKICPWNRDISRYFHSPFEHNVSLPFAPFNVNLRWKC